MQADDVLQSAAGRANPLRTSAQASSEPGARYIDFLIPGLVGMNLMNSGMWGVGFALVDYRQRKLLKRYVATPMRRSDFLLAKVLGAFGASSTTTASSTKTLQLSLVLVTFVLTQRMVTIDSHSCKRSATNP